MMERQYQLTFDGEGAAREDKDKKTENLNPWILP